jgi:hypothetical protein
VFLITTILTSATGFLFPTSKLLPSQVVGIISLAVLAVALIALYSRHLVGFWRVVYVISATIALYLNVFVGVVQTFLKVQFFNALAPTQAEPPFAVAQAIVLAIFVVIGFLAFRRFRLSAPAHA